MEDDLYETLIGAAPSDEAKIKELAAQLRRQKQVGQLGAVTGDKVLRPLGGALMQQADEYALTMQATRQRDADNLQLKRFQDSQVANWEAQLAEEKRKNSLDYDARMAAVSADRYAADMRSGGALNYKKFTKGEHDELAEAGNLVGNMHGLLAGFKDDYAAPTVLGRSIPGSRQLANWAAGQGLMAEGSNADEAQLWWAESQRLYDMFQRNKLFGATLTTNEMRSWNQANTNKSMKADQIKTMLSTILEQAAEELEVQKDFYVQAEYDPLEVEALTQRATGEEFKPRPQGRGATGSFGTKEGSETPAYTEQEIRNRLQELEERLKSK
jgi:hypothetical protein